MKCSYCGLEKRKIKQHEKFCKAKQEMEEHTESQVHDVPTVPRVVNVNPVEIKKSSNWIYLILASIFIIAGIAQYLLLQFFRIHWLFIIVLWVVDLLILVFLIWTVWRLRKKQEPIIFADLEEFINQVPKWAIDEKSPKSGIIGSILNKGKDYKQLVLVSENFEPKAVWCEWDGFLFRIGNRAYKPARDVRGDIFLYHIDKKIPLIDSANATSKDAEDSYHLLAVWNQAFSVGHAAGQSEAQGDIKLIRMLVIVIAVAVLGLAIFQYGQFGEIQTKLTVIDKAIAVLSQPSVTP